MQTGYILLLVLIRNNELIIDKKSLILEHSIYPFNYLK
jgi:hypothetical protein